MAELGEQHMVRFPVSDFGISWVESRNGRELVKFEGAEAIRNFSASQGTCREAAANATPHSSSRANQAASFDGAATSADLARGLAAAERAAAARGRMELDVTSEPSVSF